MTFELIFLTILVVGIVMVSIGLMRRIRSGAVGYLQRGLRTVDIGISYAANETRGGYRELKGKAAGYRPLASSEQEDLERQMLDIRTTPGITGEEAEREIRELPLYQRREKARGLQEVTGRLYAGVGGENEDKRSLYGEMMTYVKALGVEGHSRFAISAVSDKAKKKATTYAEPAMDAIGNWINRTIVSRLRGLRRWYGR